MKASLKAAFFVMWMVLFTMAGQKAAAQVKYLSKSGIRQVAAEEAHFFEVSEENASGGGVKTRYYVADSSKASLYTYSDLDGGEFKTGVRQGPYYEWYGNGAQKRQGYYANNRLDGEYRAYYENGALKYKMYYKVGQPQDTLTAYYGSGNIRRVEVYESGKMTSGNVFSEAGEVMEFFPMMQMPTFPGGEQAMLSYLAGNIKYPKKMAKAKVQGLVVVSFTVEKDGSLKDIEIVKSLHPDGDAEALRVIDNMPLWTPGLEEGKPVDVQYVLPVRYSIR